jgi:hypothetical protein
MTSLGGVEAFAFAGFPSFHIFKCYSAALDLPACIAAIILALGVRKAWQAANARVDDTIPR